MTSIRTPGLRGAVQRLDRRLVDERVELDDDPRLVAERGVVDLALDELEEPRAEAVRRDEQPPERRAGATGRSGR